MGHWLAQGLAGRQADRRRGRRREAGRGERAVRRGTAARARIGGEERREEGCVRDKEVGKYVRKYDDEMDERGAYIHA